MLSARDREIIFKLIDELTGAARTADSRQDALISNFERRMREVGVASVVEYLKIVEASPAEHAHLVSSLTIHTTSWFRENPHFVAFQELLLEALGKEQVFKVWCAACSTGEEVYSFALVLEEFRRVHPKFEYRVLGTDIDAISLAAAERAIYPKKQMTFHVMRYKSHILEGSGKTADYFTLSKEIRSRCSFRQNDLRNSVLPPEGPFHVCVCRNVLIYFAPEAVERIVRNLINNVRDGGHLMLGHSEAIQASDFGLHQRGHSVYARRSQELELRVRQEKPKILCLEGSAQVRRLYGEVFTEMGFDPVIFGTASEATTYLNFNDAQLITVDLNLPDMSGDKWIQMERREGLKTPVVIISENPEDGSSVDVLSLGAQDFIEKAKARAHPQALKETFFGLVRGHASAKPKPIRMGGALPKFAPDVVMIGASTGGPQALAVVLDKLPANGPPIFVTQHMSAKFTRPLAERLAELSGLKLAEMTNGAELQNGHLYFGLGDYHIGLAEGPSGKLLLVTSSAPAFNGHRPSVDFMFNSALGLKVNVMGILLTGMGRDGALGLRFLRKEGAYCIAQSEEDCVIYGMPKEAIEREGADFVGNLAQIRQVMLDSFLLRKKKAG